MSLRANSFLKLLARSTAFSENSAVDFIKVGFKYKYTNTQVYTILNEYTKILIYADFNIKLQSALYQKRNH